MRDHLTKKIIYFNLFVAAVLYLPILIPFQVYMSAYGFLFDVVLLHVLILAATAYGVSEVKK